MDTSGRWSADVLGAGFERRTLPLGRDDEGEVVATLVRRLPSRRILDDLGPTRRPLHGTDVLYVHGWSDYFFQRELAEWWAELGATFYALDLRKFGRSLRPGQTPGYIADLDEYDRDIGAALRAMGREPGPGIDHVLVSDEDLAAEAGVSGDALRASLPEHGADSRSQLRDLASDQPGPRRSTRRLVLLGHSMGGLILSLWADRHRGFADAVILNSPWLEFQGSAVGRSVLAPILSIGARIDPRMRQPRVDLGFYARSTGRPFGGEWDYDLAWRPQYGFPTHPGWLRAILEGQAKVAKGLDVGAPLLVLVSDTTAIGPVWSERMREADCVLVVENIERRALRLGEVVTLARVGGAIHDVFLSKRPVRDRAYEIMHVWMLGVTGSLRDRARDHERR